MKHVLSALNTMNPACFLEEQEREQNYRCKINTGYLCNSQCDFCYFYSKRHTSNYSLDVIKKQLDIAKEFGVSGVDFTGGEPTIHKDFLAMLEYARKLEFKYICAITNGLTLDKEYLKECQNSGLNDLLFSLHGSKEYHNRVTNVHDSYDKITQAIRNSKELGILIRINTVIVKKNYKCLPQISNFMKEVRPFQYNIIIYKMQYECGNQDIENFVTHTEASPYIKKTIDEVKKYVNYINVRYIPFCFMRGYEEHVTNYHQKKYDPFEWSNFLLPKFEMCEDDINNMCLDFLESDNKKGLNEEAVNCVRSAYVKEEVCLKCRDFFICDGFEEKYKKEVCSLKEAKSIGGEKIKNPLHYRLTWYKEIDIKKVI